MSSSPDPVVAEDLSLHVDTMRACIHGALEEYMQSYATVRHNHSRRSEASIIHDLMVKHCKAAFGEERDGDDAVFVHKRGNLSLLVVDNGKYKIKLKKLASAGLRTSNIRTNAVLAFAAQEEMQLGLPHIPSPTNLHLGYQVVDDAALLSSRVWITCPKRQDRKVAVKWTWELVAEAAVEATNVVDIAAAKQPTRKTGIARLKESAIETPARAAGDDNADEPTE